MLMTVKKKKDFNDSDGVLNMLESTSDFVTQISSHMRFPNSF